MGRYHIVGRAGAGSLIAEFLFREVGVDYDISFPDPAEVKRADFHARNPLGRIPVLICPDGHQIFETLAISTISPRILTGWPQPLAHRFMTDTASLWHCWQHQSIRLSPPAP